MAPLTHNCMYRLNGQSGHVNTTIEQNRQDHIADCLDCQCSRLNKNVSPDIKNLFSNDITKRNDYFKQFKKVFSDKCTIFTT